jgi:hypothetical protein
MQLRKSTFATGVALLVAAAALAAADGPETLAGRWQLNEKQSEDPQAKFRALRPGEDPNRPDTEEPRPGERRGSRPPDNRQRSGEAPPKLEAPPGLAEFLEAPRALVISSAENEVTLDGGSGTPLVLSLDGVAKKDGTLLTSARWEGQALVVEKKNEQGARLTIRYSLVPGHKRLEVYQRLAGAQGRAVTLRRVYDGEAES